MSLSPFHSVERNQKLAECQLPTSVKQDKGGRESAAAYHALNTQLIDELPAFIRGIEAFVGVQPRLCEAAPQLTLLS